MVWYQSCDFTPHTANAGSFADMTPVELIARIERRLRMLVVHLPPPVATRVFSAGRAWFMQQLVLEHPVEVTITPVPVRAWGIEFRLPLWNAAGMFKHGLGYDLVAAQGAGGFVAGTTTFLPREGNTLRGVRWPAVPYPRSSAASNWMGLPNPGHAAVAKVLEKVPRRPGCPVGASVSADPGMPWDDAAAGLIQGIGMYADAGVDYIELNESCPNVAGHSSAIDEGLQRRLEKIATTVLAHRDRRLPVVVKISNDVAIDQLPELLRMLISLGFDGIILGNTSTRYTDARTMLHHSEHKLYDYFVNEYGGGLSGSVVADASAQRCRAAVQLISEIAPRHEFHVVRCGGVVSARNVADLMADGVMLHQWYTGYFESFAQFGHNLYQRLSMELEALRRESNRAATLS